VVCFQGWGIELGRTGPLLVTSSGEILEEIG